MSDFFAARPLAVFFKRCFFHVIAVVSLALIGLGASAQAQEYRFTEVAVEGNQRIEGDTILSFADIARGETVSAGALNAAYQRILDSGLF